MNININPIYGEDYNIQWGKIDYTDKIVLDIGGSNGDTSNFFLSKGALLCINVDSNLDYINQCRVFIKQYKLPILPINKTMISKEDWESLIRLTNPDVVKSDCEGGELSLFDVDNDTFRLVNEYIIETHLDGIYKKMLAKCNECSYDIVDDNRWTGEINIVYAKRK